ncbi:MAG: hypothetical protein LUG86_06800 [Oscillospiraceae bacterium]|nr:hypothetical protein [Oscillospiraceae bacterium]
MKNGLEGFYEHQALELLLYYSNPRCDTNPTAHFLLNRFGSISEILNASYEDLLTVEGVGKNTACLLKFLPEFFAKYMLSSIERERLDSTPALCRYFLYKLATVGSEQLWLTCLDDNFGVVSNVKISEGNSSSVMLNMGKIAAEVVRSKCTNCVLAHNHPLGDANPSEDDIKLTELVVSSFTGLGITLVDHIIVSRTEARSMVSNEVVVLVDDMNG